jgi:ATP-binding cassette subfamily A (ABC1) protein 3
MTVEEQLQFYACLKGVPKNCLKAEVDLFLADIGLTDKRHAQSHELSGKFKKYVYKPLFFKAE